MYQLLFKEPECSIQRIENNRQIKNKLIKKELQWAAFSVSPPLPLGNTEMTYPPNFLSPPSTNQPIGLFDSKLEGELRMEWILQL